MSQATRAPLALERLVAIAIEERHAQQKPSELLALLEIVAGLTPRTVLEVGTCRGGTMWAFAQVADADATIVCVDLPGGDFGGGFDDDDLERFENFRRPGHRVATLALDSHDPATVDAVAAELGGVAVDFLFIDGDHRYEGVKLDFEMYAPFVRPGGVIALHDITPSDHEGSEVDRLWEELRERHRSRELLAPDERLEHGRWAGIGVLWVDG